MKKGSRREYRKLGAAFRVVERVDQTNEIKRMMVIL